MKTTKYILPLLLFLLVASNVLADKKGKDEDAAAKAIAEIIKTHPAVQSQRLIDELCEQYKKSPELRRSIAESLWYNWRDSTNAEKYLAQSLEIDAWYQPSYILWGDMWAYRKDTVKALKFYEMAIKAKPKNRKGYEALAMAMRFTHPEKAEAAYDLAGEKVPGYPANLQKARLYEILIPLAQKGKVTSITAGEGMNKILPFYEEALKTETDSVTPADYNNIATWYYASGTTSRNIESYKRGLEIAKEGIARYPDYILTYRSALYNATYGREYEYGVKIGEELINSKDSTLNRLDYRTLAMCYFGRHQYTKAIDGFKTLLAREDATEEDRGYAVGKIAESYKELGDYDKADNAYNEYISQRKADGKLTFYDLWQYGQMYYDKAEELNGQEKIDAYEKAADIYDQASDLDPEQAYIAQYRRYAIYTNGIVDPGYKKGLAVNPAKDVVVLLEAEGTQNLNQQKRGMLTNVYNFLGYYYLNIKENRPVCKQYWEKLHRLDPSNENARNVLTKIFKMSL